MLFSCPFGEICREKLRRVHGSYRGFRGQTVLSFVFYGRYGRDGKTGKYETILEIRAKPPPKAPSMKLSVYASAHFKISRQINLIGIPTQGKQQTKGIMTTYMHRMCCVRSAMITISHPQTFWTADSTASWYNTVKPNAAQSIPEAQPSLTIIEFLYHSTLCSQVLHQLLRTYTRQTDTERQRTSSPRLWALHPWPDDYQACMFAARSYPSRIGQAWVAWYSTQPNAERQTHSMISSRSRSLGTQDMRQENILTDTILLHHYGH